MCRPSKFNSRKINIKAVRPIGDPPLDDRVDEELTQVNYKNSHLCGEHYEH